MTAWYARRTYFVAFDKSGQVTVYQGRPGGLLLWDPTVDPRRATSRGPTSPRTTLVDVDDQKEFAPLATRSRSPAGSRRANRDHQHHDHHDDDHHDRPVRARPRRRQPDA